MERDNKNAKYINIRRIDKPWICNGKCNDQHDQNKPDCFIL